MLEAAAPPESPPHPTHTDFTPLPRIGPTRGPGPLPQTLVSRLGSEAFSLPIRDARSTSPPNPVERERGVDAWVQADVACLAQICHSNGSPRPFAQVYIQGFVRCPLPLPSALIDPSTLILPKALSATFWNIPSCQPGGLYGILYIFVHRMPFLHFLSPADFLDLTRHPGTLACSETKSLQPTRKTPPWAYGGGKLQSAMTTSPRRLC